MTFFSSLRVHIVWDKKKHNHSVLYGLYKWPRGRVGNESN